MTTALTRRNGARTGPSLSSPCCQDRVPFVPQQDRMSVPVATFLTAGGMLLLAVAR